MSRGYDIFSGDHPGNADWDRKADRDDEREPRTHVSPLPRQRVLRELVGVFTAQDMPTRCYACDARAIGTRDRRPEGGRIEQACARHADTLGGAR